MLFKLVLISFLVSWVRGQVNPYADCCENYCYREDENPYLFLGTKTAYEFVFGKASNQHIVPYCRPVQFWSFNRHGTRLPSKTNIKNMEKLRNIKDEIIKNYDNRGSYPESGRLCEKDLESLRRWQWNFTITENTADDLTDQGKDDMRYLARRYQTRYPELLRLPFSEENFKFRYTDKERTRESFEAFANGLFQADSFKVHGTSLPNDSVINAYKFCNSYQEKTDDMKNYHEYNRFKQRDEYRRLVAHVSRRLGFRFTLNDTLVKAMYDMCRFEKSWYVNKNSAWCGAFTKEHLRLMEYAEDLYYSYKSGYALDLNQKLGCFSVKDMLTRFDKIVNGAVNQPKAIVYFTHSAAVQQLLVALGIAKDSLPLTADNMKEQMRRQWRTSNLSPFSANLAAVLYECSQNEKHRVMFFLNERPVEYPGCAVGLCSWEYLRQQLADQTETCDLEFCNQSSATAKHATIYITITTLLLTFFSSL